jgi:hypothetical protein
VRFGLIRCQRRRRCGLLAAHLSGLPARPLTSLLADLLTIMNAQLSGILRWPGKTPTELDRFVPIVREVFALNRDAPSPDTLNLQLAETTDLRRGTCWPRSTTAWSNTGSTPPSPRRHSARTADRLARTRASAPLWAHPVRPAEAAQPPLVALLLPRATQPGILQ